MDLSLVRKEFTESSTIGDFMINGIRCYYSLEDRDRQRRPDGSILPWTRELKVYGETAIPYGRYQVITNYSNRFKKVMPLLLNVPDFDGIRIHAGNTDKNTHGCLLIGCKKSYDYISESMVAFNDFCPRLAAALKRGKVFITITGQVMGA